MIMNKAFSLILRSFATIALSSAIAFIILLLATNLIFQADVLIPEFFSKSFSFTASEVMRDVARDQIIPGWGTLSSIIDNPSFGVRISLLVCFFVTVIVLLIVFGLAFLLNKVVQRSTFLIVLYALFALLAFAVTIRIAYFSNYYVSMGIHRNFWFFVVSIVMIGLQALLFIGIGALIMDEENK